jgi:hypothetical protein
MVFYSLAIFYLILAVHDFKLDILTNQNPIFHINFGLLSCYILISNFVT